MQQIPKKKIPTLPLFLIVLFCVSLLCCFIFYLISIGTKQKGLPEEVSMPTEEVVPMLTESEVEEILVVNPEEQEAIINEEPVLILGDFNKTTLESLISAYGKPIRQDISKLPMFSHIEWDTNEYNIYLDYKDVENISYGGLFRNKNISCKENNFTKSQLKVLIESFSLKYVDSDWEQNLVAKKNTNKDMYANNNISGWESVTAKCGTNGYAYLNAQADGFNDWALF